MDVPLVTIIHGLRMPNKVFFHQNLRVLGLGRQFGRINFRAFGYFWATFQYPNGTVSLLSMFLPLINQPAFISKSKIFMNMGCKELGI